MRIFRDNRSFIKDNGAVALLEFALILPVLLILLLGTIELTHYIYTIQKSQSAAENILNIVNLRNNVSTTQLESISAIVPRVFTPVAVTGYKVIITAMQRDLGDDFAYIRWQKAFGGASGDSRFPYIDGAPKNLNQIDPDEVLSGFVFVEGDQVLVAEVYVPYRPIFNNDFINDLLGLDTINLYHITPPMRPRVGSFQFHPDDLV